MELGVLWVVVRGWGIGNAPATAGIALYGIINELNRLFLPLLGILALAIELRSHTKGDPA